MCGRAESGAGAGRGGEGVALTDMRQGALKCLLLLGSIMDTWSTWTMCIDSVKVRAPSRAALASLTAEKSRTHIRISVNNPSPLPIYHLLGWDDGIPASSREVFCEFCVSPKSHISPARLRCAAVAPVERKAGGVTVKLHRPGRAVKCCLSLSPYTSISLFVFSYKSQAPLRSTAVKHCSSRSPCSSKLSWLGLGLYSCIG